MRKSAFGGLWTDSDSVLFKFEYIPSKSGFEYPNLNTCQTNLASGTSGRILIVFYWGLNMYQANLASEVSGRKVMHFHSKLNTSQGHVASKASGRKVEVI